MQPPVDPSQSKPVPLIRIGVGKPSAKFIVENPEV
jgi:hypothetical protein